MPAFAFARRRDIEIETGLALAGTLVVDTPRTTKLGPEQKHMIAELVQRLSAAARAGEMSDEFAVAYGWRDGLRPDNADAITGNDELMQRWADSRLVIAVRCDAHGDGMLRIDSDTLRQLGLVKER
jgi:hypothetical protein